MKGAVDLILRWAVIAIFAILVACVTWQVLSRYVFQTPSILTDEIARFLFMWLALIGGAYTFGARRHLAIDLLPIALKGRARLALEWVILSIVAGFAAIVMVWGGWSLVSRTLSSGQVTPALRLPMGWIYAAIPFAGIVILYYCALFARDLGQGRLPEAEGDVSMPLE
ncbi:TRAP transporter small permease [Palleronia sp. LCG004]|uniref:TRAP transporter small permease n=1 Tax=Palleronia sp. LCG004 TaxID=3079304 RepID=UPI0029428BBC|nr:TRAP transporter small permease [Palleronia sp. LCG004]WOI56562.1 TRAP transporter small permease [Palleronia sp. LCG004]